MKNTFSYDEVSNNKSTLSFLYTNKGQPLVGDSSMAGQAYMNICHRILGEDVPFLDLNGKGGFFKKLSSLFKGDKKN